VVTPGDDRITVSRRDLRTLVAAIVDDTRPHLPADELAHHWACAFEEWLSRNPRTGRPRPPKTIAAYTAAWADFRLCVTCPPWHVGPADVKAWLTDMRERALHPAVAAGLITAGRRRDHIGLSEATQAQYLAAVSSFYTFAERYPLPDGRPLLAGVNPVRAKGVPRPQAKPFAEAAHLSVEQLRALLAAIRTWANSSPARQQQGLRDYALFLTYALTGGRSAEIRTLRWRDLRELDGHPQYHWANKGKSGWDELAQPAWDAIDAYLRLSGRRLSMRPGDYIFRPLPGAEFGRDLAENRPLSGHQVGALVKGYGEQAGLDPALLRVHTLRHSAAMLYMAAGSDVHFTSRLLHHGSLSTTTGYLHKVAGQRNPEWAKAWRLLDLKPLGFDPSTERRP
jgi:integrase